MLSDLVALSIDWLLFERVWCSLESGPTARIGSGSPKSPLLPYVALEDVLDGEALTTPRPCSLDDSVKTPSATSELESGPND